MTGFGEADPLIVTSMKSFGRVAGITAMVIGCINLLGWVYEISVFKYFLSNLELAQADTAFALIVGGLGLWFFVRSPGKIAVLCAWLVMLTGLLPILHYLFHTGWDINTALVNIAGERGVLKTMRMAFPTALTISLFGLGMLLLDSPRWTSGAQAFALLGILIAFLNMLGYSYSAHPAYLTLTMFVMLYFGLIFSRPDQGIMTVITGPDMAGMVARRLLPLTIGVPFILRWLVLAGQRAGMYSVEIGVTISTLASIVIFSFIIWNAAIMLNGMEVERRKAVGEVKKSNEQLQETIGKLKERDFQNSVLSDMRDVMQACTTVPETAPVIERSMNKLFPEMPGALFLLSPSRNDLEAAVRWGGFSADIDECMFIPDECWALRRGQSYLIEKTEGAMVCGHVHQHPAGGYVCVPLMAKGDVLGLLHLRQTKPDGRIADKKEMMDNLGEYLALSLANIKLRETLKFQSIRDPLTGLYNRRYMEESLQRDILRAARKKVTIGILMVDLDHFKQFNDLYGHAAGDELLVQLGNFFKSRVRGGDVACRYGGEEFTLFLPECSQENLLKRANQLREEIKDMRVHFRGQLLTSITLSMGAALYPECGTSSEELLHQADAALYRAKQEGRDRVVAAF